jgi:hypothetical protein
MSSAPVAAAVLLAAWGCGGDAAPVVETAKAYATVSGKVTVKGQPAKKGKVTFDLTNASPLAGSSRTADVKGDGTYEAEAPVGKNSVAIGGTGHSEADGSYNTTTFEVKEGKNTLDLDLPIKQ